MNIVHSVDSSSILQATPCSVSQQPLFPRTAEAGPFSRPVIPDVDTLGGRHHEHTGDAFSSQRRHIVVVAPINCFAVGAAASALFSTTERGRGGTADERAASADRQLPSANPHPRYCCHIRGAQTPSPGGNL
jgi:hypothetical protein